MDRQKLIKSVDGNDLKMTGNALGTSKKIILRTVRKFLKHFPNPTYVE